MTVFKTFLKIIKSKLPQVLIYVVIFMVLGLIMAQNSADDNGFSNTKLTVSIIDEDNSSASTALSEFIGERHDIKDIENDKDVILDRLYYQQVNYVLIIKDGFEDRLSNGETDGLFSDYKVDGNYSSQLMDSTLNQYISTVSSFINGGNSMEEAVAKTSSAFSNEISITKESISSAGSDDYGMLEYYFFMFLPYIFISILVSAICPCIFVMLKKDIKQRAECSCVSSRKYITSIIAAAGLFVILVWLAFMLEFLISGKFKMNATIGYAMLNSFVFLLIATLIALLVSVAGATDKTAPAIANVVGLGMSFLCGIFVPQSMLGDGVLAIGRFLPAYWYVKINDMLGGYSGEAFMQSAYFKYLGIEMIFAVIIFIAIVIIMKRKRKWS